jgi:hypothetical protein
LVGGAEVIGIATLRPQFLEDLSQVHSIALETFWRSPAGSRRCAGAYRYRQPRAAAMCRYAPL